MIRVEIAPSTDARRVSIQVLADGGERHLFVEGSREVALMALIEYLRGLIRDS